MENIPANIAAGTYRLDTYNIQPLGFCFPKFMIH